MQKVYDTAFLNPEIFSIFIITSVFTRVSRARCIKRTHTLQGKMVIFFKYLTRLINLTCKKMNDQLNFREESRNKYYV